jgi:hypothetical protein
MDPTPSYRPRVSGETRRLLTAGVIAIAALWLLARFRFQDQPVTPNPVPSVLAQLNPGPQYETLASEIADLTARVQPLLSAFDLPTPGPSGDASIRRVTAFKWRADLALALLSGDPSREGGAFGIRSLAPASRFAVVQIPGASAAPLPTAWTARRLQQPRYLAVTEISDTTVSLRPVFVPSLNPTDSAFWPGVLWAMPSVDDVRPGAFLFTMNAELVGLVVANGTSFAVVPSETLFAEAERLLSMQERPAGTIGIEVQALTPQLAALTGTDAGVIVTWVQVAGSAAGALMVGDVIEATDGSAVADIEQWRARTAGLAAGETVALRVRRRGQPVRDVSLEASPVRTVVASRALGLTMRRRARAGAEITDVQSESAADRAGLATGDVVTLFGDVAAPTPAQITRVFASTPLGGQVMVAVTRGEAHHVLTLTR